MRQEVYAGMALRELLYAPRSLIERRIETYVLPSRRTFEWNISQQIRIPRVADLEAPDDPGTFTISLGLYEKSRTPDLVARRGSTKLGILPRNDRGRKIAAAMLDHFIEHVPFGDVDLRKSLIQAAISGDGNSTSPEFEVIQEIHQSIVEVVISSEQKANKTAKRLEEHLKSSWPELLDSAKYFDDDPDQSFIQQIHALCGTTHVLAEVTAAAGDAVIIDVVYTALVLEPDAPFSASDTSELTAGTGLDKWVHGVLSKNSHALRTVLVPWHRHLGLLPRHLAKAAHMADHCLSFYLLADPPAGMEIRRSYWSGANFPKSELGEDNGDSSADTGDDSGETDGSYYSPALESEGAVLSLHRSDGAKCDGFPAVANYHLAISRHGWLRLVWAQMALILGLSLLFAAGVFERSSPNQALIFGLPGTIASFVTFTRSEYANTATAWLRTSVVALSVLSLGYVLGLSVDTSMLPGASSLPLARLYTSGTAATSTLLTVLVGWLTFGRLPDRSPTSTDVLEDLKPEMRIEEARAIAATCIAVILAVGCFVAVFVWMS